VSCNRLTSPELQLLTTWSETPGNKSSQAAAVPMLATCTVVKRKVGIPQHGRVNTFPSGDIAWTGGNPYNTNITTAANSHYRPMELDKPAMLKTSVYNPYQRLRG